MKKYLLVWIKAFVVGSLILTPLTLLSGALFPDIVFGEERMGTRDWYYYFQGMVVYVVFSELGRHYNSKETNQ